MDGTPVGGYHRSCAGALDGRPRGRRLPILLRLLILSLLLLKVILKLRGVPAEPVEIHSDLLGGHVRL